MKPRFRVGLRGRNERRRTVTRSAASIFPSRARPCRLLRWQRRFSADGGGLGQPEHDLSFPYINAVLALPDRTSTEKLVLFVLANHANERGFCWPAQTTIAKECSLSRSAVIRTLAKLEARGLITRRAHFPSLGYVLNVAHSHTPVAVSDTHVAHSHIACSPKLHKPSGTSMIHNEPKADSPEGKRAAEDFHNSWQS